MLGEAATLSNAPGLKSSEPYPIIVPTAFGLRPLRHTGLTRTSTTVPTASRVGGQRLFGLAPSEAETDPTELASKSA